MKLHLIAVGHKMPGWINSGYDDYVRRMPPDLPLLLTEIKPGHRVAGEDGLRGRGSLKPSASWLRCPLAVCRWCWTSAARR